MFKVINQCFSLFIDCNIPAPPLYPLAVLVQRSSSCTLPLASSSASTSSQPLALAFHVQRCSSGTDTISLPQAEYLASPSQLLAVFVQLSSSGTGTVPLPPAVYLGSTSQPLAFRVQRSSGSSTTSVVSLLVAALQQPIVITGKSQVWRCEESMAGNQFLRVLRFTPRRSEESYVLCMNVLCICADCEQICFN